MDEYINNNVDQLLDTTQEILKIKSVEEPPLPGMPFGEGPAKALNYVLELADSFGMKTKNLDNYVGWAEWGNGEELIGVLVHLDVVPEGSGWSYPPYGAQIHDGKIYARGAMDNKGPAMAALFALKSLKDAGIKFNKRVRIIFGTNEETGFECIKHYIAHEEIPTMGFSPDANYPIINGEKGIMTFTFKTDFNCGEAEPGFKILSFKGGERPNMVPDFAEAVLSGEYDVVKKKLEIFNKEKDYDIKLIKDNGNIVLKSYGTSAHGSTPEKGQNAIMQLTALLGEVDLCSSQKHFIKFLNEKIGLDTTGKNLQVDFYDKLSGHLTFNVGVAEINEENAEVTINIRYPIESKGDNVLQNIRKNTPDTISIADISDKEPHYVPEDNLMIQKLKEAYEKVTGEEAYCFTIGGGTYARMFKNCVAFGPTFPGKPELAHEKDEYIEVEDLVKNLKIYAYVLKELVK